MTELWTEEQLERFLQFLKEKRGLDFTGYKRASVARRVARRLQAAEVAGLSTYMDRLEVDPEEFVHLLNTILINVTSFFRDTQAWEFLQEQVVPQIIAAKEPYAPIRVWSAGCASGEEAYSLAIVLAEALGEEAFRERVKIYATDIDEEALGQARRATYSARALEPVSEELRAKYFRLVNGQFTFNPELRRAVIFGRHNLLVDAPISNLDLLVSRNTLMYFNAESQRRVLSLFHFALNNTGYLFLGKAEMLLTHAHLFTPIHLRHRIFRKVPVTTQREQALVMAQGGNGVAMDQLDQSLRLREAAYETSPTAEVVVDINWTLVSANAAARALFGILPEDIGRQVQDLTISYRPLELRSRLDQVFSRHRPLREVEVEFADPRGEARTFDVDFFPLAEAGGVIGASIAFTETTQYRDIQGALERTKEELQNAYEELQSSNEELETTNEELQSSNEELETTNEELQSSNEELETMNEELQSANEELHTANEQLRLSTDDTNRANAFLQSVLRNLKLAVVVVNTELVVLTWNEHAEEMWGLRAEEVVGDFLLNLEFGLPLEQVRALVRRTASGESRSEEVTLQAVNRRGREIRCRVAMAPLLGHSRDVTGVIIMMDEVPDTEDR